MLFSDIDLNVSFTNIAAVFILDFFIKDRFSCYVLTRLQLSCELLDFLLCVQSQTVVAAFNSICSAAFGLQFSFCSDRTDLRGESIGNEFFYFFLVDRDLSRIICFDQFIQLFRRNRIFNEGSIISNLCFQILIAVLQIFLDLRAVFLDFRLNIVLFRIIVKLLLFTGQCGCQRLLQLFLIKTVAVNFS